MKVGFWLKGATGKLAGTTLYKDSSTGETVAREVVTPANPKTDKQLIQRVVMHTVGSSFSKMREIVDHSFEGFKRVVIPSRTTFSRTSCGCVVAFAS